MAPAKTPLFQAQFANPTRLVGITFPKTTTIIGSIKKIPSISSGNWLVLVADTFVCNTLDESRDTQSGYCNVVAIFRMALVGTVGPVH